MAVFILKDLIMKNEEQGTLEFDVNINTTLGGYCNSYDAFKSFNSFLCFILQIP